MTHRNLLITCTCFVLVFCLNSVPVQAGDWSISIGGWGPYYGQPRHQYYPYYQQYPYYNPYNPVVNRDFYHHGYARDPYGRVHSGDTTVDRHRSYYSPGRNQAITRPQTSVQQYGGPGYSGQREHTWWIGADGRPHSTTVDRTTTVDPWGNTHTDTNVTLKNRQRSPENNNSEATRVEPGKPKRMYPGRSSK